jgi:ethanolamine utilization protein EutA (predicted chaperonin)
MAFFHPYGAGAASAGQAAMEYAWSRERLALHEDIFDHSHFDPEQAAAIDAYIRSQECLELKTVGIDIGSSTSHLLFAKIVLEREAQDLSNRYVVVRREIVWRSPIMLTPFTAHGTIDAEKLGAFIEQCYRDAGVQPDAIDSGAVILTGEAIKKTNAEAIDELFAGQAGKFVCATAGHQLEATLTAHGSGAVAYSENPDICVLHVDIGGGTTKLALIEGGVVLDVCAFAVGGRLIATDENGDWTRIDDTAVFVARDLGVPATAASFADPAVRARIASRLADVAIDYITGAPLDALARSLLLTPELNRTAAPAAITFSGGVAEYIFQRQVNEFGDVAPLLANELRARFRARLTVPVVDPGAGIRATVIGASQFSVQVSGKTIYVSDHALLPLRNVPVVRLEIPAAFTEAGLEAALRRGIERLERPPDAVIAVSFAWTRDPEYRQLRSVGRALERALADSVPRTVPLVVLIDGDVGRTIGHLLRDELGLTCGLISIDGVDLRDFDYVDIGTMMTPPGVIPLVIKSLVFR